MKQPISLQSGNLLSLGKQYFQSFIAQLSVVIIFYCLDVLNDDYPHKTFETEAFTATTENNNIFHFKSECTKTQNNLSQSQFSIKDEIKFQYRLWGQNYMQTKVNKDGEIKYHFDFGNYEILQKDHVIFAAIKTDMQLDKFWTRVGLGHVSPTYSLWKRIERNYQGEYSFSLMGQHTHGPFLFGYSGIYNFSKMKVQKYDMVLNYNKNGVDLTFQHFSIQHETNLLKLGKLLVAAAYKLNNQYSIAAWVISIFKNMETEKQRVVFGAQSQQTDKLLLKGKIDGKGKTTLSTKLQLCSTVWCTVGAQINFLSLLKGMDFKKFFQIPFGYRLDINI